MAGPRTLSHPFRVGADHPALAGHFPGRPVVPGVVLLDIALEAATGLLGREPEVAELAQAKFLVPLLPEQPARIELSHAGAALDFRIVREDDTMLAQGRFVLRERTAP